MFCNKFKAQCRNLHARELLQAKKSPSIMDHFVSSNMNFLAPAMQLIVEKSFDRLLTINYRDLKRNMKIICPVISKNSADGD
uniref:Uncharacterized protein n=1 Tax=Romanomermis culicivorax TaxID=13658 RepID=A0A915HQ83_ROMCU